LKNFFLQNLAQNALCGSHLSYKVGLLQPFLEKKTVSTIFRLGGGFGIKISRCNQIACAAALA
jgi:hypothetical protein